MRFLTHSNYLLSLEFEDLKIFMRFLTHSNYLLSLEFEDLNNHQKLL